VDSLTRGLSFGLEFGGASVVCSVTGGLSFGLEFGGESVIGSLFQRVEVRASTLLKQRLDGLLFDRS
jgi:hypothetical protein